MTLGFSYPSCSPSQALPFSECTPELSTGVRLGSEQCLSSFLRQCEDSKVDALTEALQATVMRWKCKFPAPLPLELYTSSNFIGLFVKEESAEVLKKFAADFAAEAASKAGEWLQAASECSQLGQGLGKPLQRGAEGAAHAKLPPQELTPA